MKSVVQEKKELRLNFVLEGPPPGVDFGVQKGSGSDYSTVQKQRSSTGNLFFDLSIQVKKGKDNLPIFTGPFVQGPPKERFIYIDIGTYAGQEDSSYGRRLKIPLAQIDQKMVHQVFAGSGAVEAKIKATGKDGGPACGTVKPFDGWKLKEYIN